MSRLESIREEVRKAADYADWNFHIVPVAKYAKLLAKMLGADEELAEAAALLHDIGRLKFGGKDHHITGIPEAEKIMQNLGYSQPEIDEVKHCIESHRGSEPPKPRTITAKIIANADAMAHFDILPVFFYWRSKKQEFGDAFKWVEDKIERDWNAKLTIPEAKKMMEEKYKAIKLVLDSTKQYF